MHVLDRVVFSFAEGLVKTARDPGMLFVHVFTDDEDMHDGKDLGALVIVDFDFLVVGKQTFYFPRAVTKTGRAAGRDQRVDLAAFKHAVKSLVVGNRLNLISGGRSSLTRSFRPGSSCPPRNQFISWALTP